jgi:hypothetical protein
MTNLEYYIQQYTCENRAIAKIMIPADATQDDLKGIREMLDVVIKRHFKAGSENYERNTRNARSNEHI